MAGGWWLGVLVGLAACGRAPEERLGLRGFRQSDVPSVALNEELRFYFTSELERSSVTTDSVRILDARGREVAGKRVVRGDALSFFPELPCAPDLSDGGLRPGERYSVLLGGFPRLDGLRSESGAPLSATLILAFRTAEVGGTAPLFLDLLRGPHPLTVVGEPMPPNLIELATGGILLECGEALDPSYVPHARFELSHYPSGGREREQIPLTARLLVNRRDHAELLLEASGPERVPGEGLPPDKYYLRMQGRDLRTLGGRVVELLPPLVNLSVPERRVEIDLGAPRERSAEPPGCASTALWDERNGRLVLRFPAAAGSGLAGAQELREVPLEADLQCTSLLVAEGVDVDLSAHVGPLVLRAQGSLEIRGRLRRRGPGKSPDPLTEELVRASQLAPEHWTPLSAWVERLLDARQPWAREPWTVLIAGGDIRVPRGGALEVEGPLVLVAGGWIRVEGDVVAQGDLWKTPEGGGMRALGRLGLELLPLVLDPPSGNPLRTTLEAGLVTRSIPWTGKGGPWRMQLNGAEGSGRIEASLLQAREPGGPERAYADPGQLQAGSARVLVRLGMGPGQGEAWDPPTLERLRFEALPRDAAVRQ